MAFGIVIVRTPSFRSARDPVDVDRLGQREGARKAAVAAFDAVILLAGDVAAGDRGPRPADDDAELFDVDVDLIARQAGQFSGQDELGGGLVEVDRRRPAGRVGADELTECSWSASRSRSESHRVNATCGS